MLIHVKVTEEDPFYAFNHNEYKEIYINPDHIVYASVTYQGCLCLNMVTGETFHILTEADVIDKNCEALNQLAKELPTYEDLLLRFDPYDG